MKTFIMPDKVATAVAYCTSGTLICGGVSKWIENINWNTAAIIVGMVIGVATFLVNWYYKRREDARAEALKDYQINHYQSKNKPEDI